MLRIAYHPIYCHPLPEGHRFPMLKYELIPGQLLHEGLISPQNLFEPQPAPEEVITATHDSDYWKQLKNLELEPSHIRRIGFPLTPELVQREIILAQGTIDCAFFAMQHGVALNVAGGTHHAFAGKGEGFCLLNDVAIAARYLLDRNLVKKILVADLDVHQGNGTASIFKDEARVFTFSMHGRHNYPFHKERSDLDVELEDGTGDEIYLGQLHNFLPGLLDEFKPGIVFFNSGVDILETDKYGKLSVSVEGCRQRDLIVFSECRSRGIPVVAAMGGGYSPRISDIVNAHCNTFRCAEKVFFH